MNDIQIKYFIEIVKNDINFTKAAQAVFISQPALSKQMAKLEKELGVQLFDSATRSATKLTPAGQHLFTFFENSRSRFHTALNEAKRLNNKKERLLVACAADWNIGKLLPNFKSFMEKTPDISISFNSSGFRTLLRGVEDSSFDLAIAPIHLFENSKDLSFCEITQARRIVLFPAIHMLAKKKDLTISDFSYDILYVLSLDEIAFAKKNCEEYCLSHGFLPRIELLPNLDSIFMALEQGSGYTILDEWCRSKNLPTMRYVTLDDYLSIGLAWRRDNPGSAVHSLVDYFRSTMQLNGPALVW